LLGCNWLQVFQRAYMALLGSGRALEQRTSRVPSEKCAGGWGSDDDDMRMITASFGRAIERFAGSLCLHFLLLFQQVVAIRKTCNQLRLCSALLQNTYVRCRLVRQGEQPEAFATVQKSSRAQDCNDSRREIQPSKHRAFRLVFS